MINKLFDVTNIESHVAQHILTMYPCVTSLIVSHLKKIESV
ncbi:hypothetical protein CLV81_1993 [Flagellimonas meridianipacifica]|uniref:Uncharacterized protein n=1 Tax=Flagellimonas meridianipacifica TaxID=1080225 RepID=A0A2T0M817_9FLAO|nr:hypothetical protein CLV81_1993 [Allomuricauda pacifica]